MVCLAGHTPLDKEPVELFSHYIPVAESWCRSSINVIKAWDCILIEFFLRYIPVTESSDRVIMNYQGKEFLDRSPRSPGRRLSPSHPRGRGRTSPGLALPEDPWSVGSSWQLSLLGLRKLTCMWYQSLDQLPATEGQFSGVVFAAEKSQIKEKTMKIISPSPQAGWNYQLGLSIQFHSTKSWSRQEFKGFFLLLSPVNHPDCTIVILHCFVDPLARLQSVS